MRIIEEKVIKIHKMLVVYESYYEYNYIFATKICGNLGSGMCKCFFVVFHYIILACKLLKIDFV